MRLQLVAGFVCLFVGVWPYSRNGNALSLLLVIVGAILATVACVTMAVKQALRDEWRRRKSEQQPVLNI